jgi:enamine deaminase RidA (YjgF/YER057c/UK114 family)
LKNVDAEAAKELMANLVKMQSSLTDVNKYVGYLLFNAVVNNST